MSAVHHTVALRKLVKMMSLAEIARAVACNRTTLDRAMKGERHSDFPAEIADKLAALLAEQTRARH